MAVHFLFIAFALFGSFLVLWKRWIIWLHLPALAWALWVEASAGLCPLTPLEQGLRLRAGERGFSGSFIDHYLGALIYPQGLTPAAQMRIALVLGAYNLLLYGLMLRRAQRRRRMR